MIRQEKTVRDVISACDLQEVAQEFDKRFNWCLRDDTEEKKKERVDKFLSKMEQFRRMLFSLPVVPNTEDLIIISVRFWDFGDESVCALMYEKKDFRHLLDITTDETLPEISDLTVDNAEEMAKTFHDTDIVANYGFEFMDWKQVLAAEVIQDNAERFGLNLFAAEILWEMTFNGFTEEQQKERRDELEASIDETERIMSLPEEERAEHLHEFSMSDMYEQLGIDPPTEEEQEKERKAIHLEIVKNQIAKIGELQRIKQEGYLHV